MPVCKHCGTDDVVDPDTSRCVVCDLEMEYEVEMALKQRLNRKPERDEVLSFLNGDEETQNRIWNSK